MSKATKERFYGLEKGTYIRSTAWKCDMDQYHFPLDEDSKQWLNTYAECEMKGSFKEGHRYTEQEKRDVFKDIYRAKNDLYSIQDCSGRMVCTDDILDYSANMFQEECLVLLIDYEAAEQLKASRIRKSKNRKKST